MHFSRTRVLCPVFQLRENPGISFGNAAVQRLKLHRGWGSCRSTRDFPELTHQPWPICSWSPLQRLIPAKPFAGIVLVSEPFSHWSLVSFCWPDLCLWHSCRLLLSCWELSSTWHWYRQIILMMKTWNRVFRVLQFGALLSCFCPFFFPTVDLCSCHIFTFFSCGFSLFWPKELSSIVFIRS